MANIFKLPDIGEGLAEAEIVRWLIPVGGLVAMDQPVVEVETDKAVVEIPSPYAGTVLHHGGEEGQVVEVGSILVVVGDAEEVWPPSETSSSAAPIVGSISEEAVDVTVVPSSGPQMFSRRVAALPVVRMLAKDLGVDLESVIGTGPEGRITREDVRAAAGEISREQVAESPPSEADVPPAPPEDTPQIDDETPPAPDETPGGTPELPDPNTRQRLSRLRRTIAANMVKSWNEIPHVTTFDSVDASRLLAAKKALGARHGTSVSLDALIVKAVLPALAVHPELAASLDGDDMIISPSIDVGVAVDTEDGLMVVVVKNPGALTLLELSAQIAALAEKAKNRTAGPDELTGQHFTVSNIGAVGGGFGTPIVPPGTAAILSVGRAAEQPVARDGAVEIAPMLPLSLSYDHRLIDGGKGRRFMAMVIENLEEPALFLA